jgi:hypothetical protein
MTELTIAPEVEILGDRFEKHTLPNGDVIYYEDKWHSYYTEVYQSGGQYRYKKTSKLLGVSTIAKYLDQNTDGLLWWAAKLDQTGIAELACRTFDEELSPSWLRSQVTIDKALRKTKKTWSDMRDKAATRGTSVHEKILNALATDTEPPSLDSLEEHERGYGQAAFKFWADRKPEPVSAERVTASVEHGFAGRFDLIAKVDDELRLYDAKTRDRPATYKSDHTQLAGYEVGNAECGLPTTEGQYVLLLMPDGNYKEVRSVATEHHFMAALQAAKADRALYNALKAAESAEEAEEYQQQLEVAAA